jgi:hypothetical protein
LESGLELIAVGFAKDEVLLERKRRSTFQAVFDLKFSLYRYNMYIYLQSC